MIGRPCVDIVGKRFSRLIVLDKTNKRMGRTMIWKCVCDCGNETFVSTGHLRSGHTTSCGCYQVENRKIYLELRTKHGNARRGIASKEYITWRSMKDRCFNPSNEFYKDYGGRGIKVCDAWMKFEGFLQYLKDSGMYPKPAGLSIDRIKNDGNYEPGNIHWATALQQNNNRRPCKKAA